MGEDHTLWSGNKRPVRSTPFRFTIGLREGVLACVNDKQRSHMGACRVWETLSSPPAPPAPPGLLAQACRGVVNLCAPCNLSVGVAEQPRPLSPFWKLNMSFIIPRAPVWCSRPSVFCPAVVCVRQRATFVYGPLCVNPSPCLRVPSSTARHISKSIGTPTPVRWRSVSFAVRAPCAIRVA